MERKTRLLFSNVAVECTQEYLRQWIEARGYKTSTVHLIQDLVSGTSPSFAYVQLMDAAKLDEAARALHGQTLLGQSVRVCQVVPLQTAVQPPRKLSASA
jgi:uncharacterized protein YggL (DUF469 family)